MKKILLILLLFFSLFSVPIKAEVSDTSKAQMIQVDIRKDILKNLYNGFVKGNLDSLVIFCDSYVDFTFQRSPEVTLQENMTDYKAIDNINNILKEIPYSHFSISSTKTRNFEDVFLVQLYLVSDNTEYEVDIFFILNVNKAISKIAIY